MTDWPAELAAAKLELEAARQALAASLATKHVAVHVRDPLREAVAKAESRVRVAEFEVDAEKRRRESIR